MPLNEGLIFDLEVDFGRFSSAFERVFGLVMKLGLATGFLLGILRVFSDRMAAPTEAHHSCWRVLQLLRLLLLSCAAVEGDGGATSGPTPTGTPLC